MSADSQHKHKHTKSWTNHQHLEDFCKGWDVEHFPFDNQKESVFVFQGSWLWKSPGRTSTMMLWLPHWRVFTFWSSLEPVSYAEFADKHLSRQVSHEVEEETGSWTQKVDNTFFLNFFWAGNQLYTAYDNSYTHTQERGFFSGLF